MSPRQQARLLGRLEREHGPSVRKAFEQAIRDLRSGVDFSALQRAIAAGDVGRAVAAIGLAEPLFRDFETELQRAFEGAGRRMMDLMPRDIRGPQGNRVVFRFNMRNRQAEERLRLHSAQKVNRMVGQTGDDIAGLREFLSQGMRDGVNPRTTAQRIVGKINPATGRREGSLIGLSRPQQRYVYGGINRKTGQWQAGALDELDGSKSQLENYLTRKLRDRRFDSYVRKAIETGERIPANIRSKMLARYADRMLQHRAEVIARTETLNAIRAGKHEAIDQAAQQAGLPDQAVQRKWDASGDADVRPDHEAADGQTVGKNEPFIVGGASLMYPGDPNGPPEQTVQCRCQEIAVIDWFQAEN